MQPEGVSNKGKSVMSHPRNTPNADGSPERHPSESLTTGKTGQLVEVYRKRGSMSRGYLQHGADGIVLEVPSATKKQATGEFVWLPPIYTVIVPADEILKVVYVEDNRGEDQLLSGLNSAYDSINLTDAELWTRWLKESENIPYPHVAEVRPRTVNDEYLRLDEAQIQFTENDRIESMKKETMCNRIITNVANDVPLDIPTHSYGPGSFYIQGLPDPYLGKVVGLLGGKSTGKSTCLKILAGHLKPNLGRFENPPEWEEIVDHFDTEAIRTYLTRLQTNTLNVALKEQDLRAYRSSLTVRTSLAASKDTDFDSVEELIDDLDMTSLADTIVNDLSEAELQRFAIASTVVQMADVYLFDEPTNFLDARQKYQVARVILSVVKPDRYVCVTDNDVNFVDWMCDCIHFTGEETKYGEVTLSSFADLYDGTEGGVFYDILTPPSYAYPSLAHKSGNFSIQVMRGELRSCELSVVLGNVKTGKTLFLDCLRGTSIRPISSHKPQDMISCERRHETVGEYLYSLIRFSCQDSLFKELVLRPLGIMKILDKKIKEVSQSSLQKIAIATCLGKAGARVFMLDEPSIHLDAMERVVASQVIKRFILHSRTTALVVEQDLMMATYMADRVIIIRGESGVQSTVHSPVSKSIGMNSYLSDLNMTCRTDPVTSIARMNKPGSVEDKEQKASGQYFKDIGRRVQNMMGRIETWNSV